MSKYRQLADAITRTAITDAIETVERAAGYLRDEVHALDIELDDLECEVAALNMEREELWKEREAIMSRILRFTDWAENERDILNKIMKR